MRKVSQINVTVVENVPCRYKRGRNRQNLSVSVHGFIAGNAHRVKQWAISFHRGGMEQIGSVRVSIRCKM